MSWLFSQALVEEYSAGTSLAGQPCVQLSVMPTPHKFWRNGKTMDASSLSQFGLTLQLLTDAHGAELLTSFQAGFLVKTSAQQVGALGLAASAADCGRNSQESLAIYSLDSSTWKTAQCSLLADLGVFSATWPKWGLMRNGACWGRITPTLPTSEKGYGFLPTPDASMGARGASINKTNRRANGGKRQITINDIVGGRPNPDWTEWVMGWPIGWTDLRPLATAKFQEWQQQHSKS